MGKAFYGVTSTHPEAYYSNTYISYRFGSELNHVCLSCGTGRNLGADYPTLVLVAGDHERCNGNANN